MLDRTMVLVGRIRDWLSRIRSHPGYRILLGAMSVGILAVSVWFIWKQLSRGYATVSTASLDLEPQRLIISWISITAATALGAWEWVLLVRALGGQLDLAQGMSIHLTWNLAKYVPGFIWSYAGKGYHTVRQGVPGAIVTLSIGAEFAIVYFCGALLILLALPFSGLVPLPAGGRVALQAVGIGAAGLLILGLPSLAQRISLRNRSTPAQFEPLVSANWSRIAFVILAVLMTWFLLAFGFSVLYGQSLSEGWSHFLGHAVALAGALLLGQIVVFAPTGVGVREAVLVALLASQGSAAEVLILALIFRMQMILGEILCAIVAAAAVRIRRARQNRSRMHDNTNG